MNEQLKIDKDRFLNDVLDMGNYITNNNMNYNRYHFLNFLSLNDLAAQMYGEYIDELDLIKYKPNISLDVKKAQEREFIKFCEFISNNGKYLNEVYKNINEYLKSINFIPICCDDKLKVFNKSEIKDIISNFYGNYSDTYYKIIKKYFDENRIEYGFDLDPNFAAMYAQVVPIQSGYIFTDDRKLNSRFMSYLIHEFGHAIDAETFMFPQQKVIGVMEDPLLEVPSTCFENLYIQQLINDRIDYTGGLLLNNYIYLDLLNSSKILTDVLKNDDITIDDYGFANITKTSEDGSEITELSPLRDPLIYSLGNLFALHFKELDKKDKKIFLKAFKDVITSRKESSLDELIEKLGVTKDDFATLKYVKEDIKDNDIKLKKRFNIYS